MCTVTYLPLNGPAHFILTNNRDEAPHRHASVLFYNGDTQLAYPREPIAGGTWLVLSAQRRLVCLLNGADFAHKRQTPYRKSRGLVLLDAMQFATLDDFASGYQLKGIEPFSLIIFENNQLALLRWNGHFATLKPLNANQPEIWSSSTLYPTHIASERQQWFDHFLSHQQQAPPTAAQILQFHRTAGSHDPQNALVMNRNNIVQTISISQIEVQQHSAIFTYFDLVDNSQQRIRMEFEPQPR
ncbi:MAG: NRDE family protein [Sphingobacteriales bacterium]|jgi:hypothetical protein|nr:NRDE family protein [Sphingobacteriales bacterium]MBP9142044.1 NRDE family protein [Chitinophagales bacterium]MDA0198162.1 NRDE family protein [Bacteroidota bacterium]MBK6889622.1 NRDE family protein [Sphingobacteriales bacterium]MBK7527867.1 NRDE family protein [Sphingobacteriales bacterium]